MTKQPTTYSYFDSDCICTHTGWSHVCDDLACPRFSEHTEHCQFPGCDCRDFLSVDERYKSAKQVNMDYRTDLVRHESVDMPTRETDMTDVNAAYRDRYGHKPTNQRVPKR